MLPLSCSHCHPTNSPEWNAKHTNRRPREGVAGNASGKTVRVYYADRPLTTAAYSLMAGSLSSCRCKLSLRSTTADGCISSWSAERSGAAKSSLPENPGNRRSGQESDTTAAASLRGRSCTCREHLYQLASRQLLDNNHTAETIHYEPREAIAFSVNQPIKPCRNSAA